MITIKRTVTPRTEMKRTRKRSGKAFEDRKWPALSWNEGLYRWSFILNLLQLSSHPPMAAEDLSALKMGQSQSTVSQFSAHLQARWVWKRFITLYPQYFKNAWLLWMKRYCISMTINFGKLYLPNVFHFYINLTRSACVREICDFILIKWAWLAMSE